MIFTQVDRLAGFGLTPLGWRMVVRGDASRMVDRLTSLSDRVGGLGERLRRDLLCAQRQVMAPAAEARAAGVTLSLEPTPPPDDPDLQHSDRKAASCDK